MPPCRQTSVAPLPGLRHARLDFRQGQVVAAFAQVLGHAPLGKGAETAAEIADVGVVDVAVDHVADRVAVHRAAQVVGGLDYERFIGAPGIEQADDFSFIEARAGHRLADQ